MWPPPMKSETHYNLGIASRNGPARRSDRRIAEGLSAIDRGHPFAQIMQTYTWLAQCFLEREYPRQPYAGITSSRSPPSTEKSARTQIRLASAYKHREISHPPSGISWMFSAATSIIATSPSASRP